MPTPPARTPSTRRLRPNWVVLGLLMLLALVVVARRTGVEVSSWETDLVAAQQRAAIDGRCLLIEFWLPGCTYCRIMEAEVLPDDRVHQALAEWIPVRLDMTRERELANRYRVTGAPTFVALSPGGEAIGRIEGYQPPERFAEFLNRARSAASARPLTGKPADDPR